MSSFQDTFTKNEKDNTDLQYDDAASYFFFSAILLILMIPFALNIYRTIQKRPKFKDQRFRALTKKKKKFIKKAKAEFKKSKYSGFFKMKIFLLLGLLYLFFFCISRAGLISELKTFDPYEILGVDMGVNKRKVKKAYFKLAKIYHPDVNQGDPEASAKFQLINKAYRCFEDDDAMQKCLKSGNPDGATNFKVAIAFPSALLDKKNRALILSLFFLIILVILPVTVWLWYSEREKYGEGGVSRESIGQSFFFLKNENLTVKNVLEMCTSSVELRAIFKPKRGQGSHLAKLMKKFGSEVKTSVAKQRAFYLKTFYMTLGYMRREQIAEPLEEDMRLIFKKVPALLNAFSDIGVQMYAGGCPPGLKPISYSSLMNIYYFSQLFYQGMWMHQSEFLQIPGVTEANVTKLEKKLKGKVLKDVIKDEILTDKLLNFMNTKSDLEAARKVVNALPKMQMSAECFIDEAYHEETYAFREDLEEQEEGEEEKKEQEPEPEFDNKKIHQGDLVTIEIKLTDESVPEGEEASYYFTSQYYPYPKYVNWSIFLLNAKRKLIDFKTAVGNKRETVVKFQRMERSRGDAFLIVLAKPDCYVGFEQETILRYTIHGKREREEIVLHPDDEEACNQPTLFSQLRAQLKDEDSDEELEDDEIESEEEEEEEEQEEEEKEEDQEEEDDDAPKVKVE